jgi:predicted kinase
VEALLFDVDAETCKQRNRGRDRVVPEDVIDRMAAKLVKPTRREGFSRVRTVPERHRE